MLCLFSLVLQASDPSNEIINIRGIVTDDRGAALSEVQIALPLAHISTFSEENGFFELNFSADKSEKIIFYKFGYKPFEVLPDTIKSLPIRIKLQALSVNLESVEVSAKTNFYGNYLRDVEGLKIYTAKKNDLIKMNRINANLATASARQIYARISGLNIWESDANGNQLEIGGRGLNPSRSANFNVRQNGYDISADALGYPESYYTPSPLAVDKIEVLRGASALQYGSQFGGLINFELLKNPTKKLEGKVHQSLGSFNLSNTYIQIASKQKYISTKAYLQYKTGDGFINRSEFESIHAYINTSFNLSEKLSAKIEFTKMHSLAQQPGGLTDKQFEEDPYQNTRFGNWFEVDWNLPSISLNYKVNDKLSSELIYFALFAERNALGYLRAPNRIDPILLTNSSYSERQRDLLQDKFVNHGIEFRNLLRYTFKEKPAALAFGIRLFNGTSEKQQSNAAPGDAANFEADYSQDTEDPVRLYYNFNNYNAAFYAENTFSVGNWKLAPGLRVEFIETQLDGYYNQTVRDQAGNTIQRSSTPEKDKRPRSFLIAGMGISHKINNKEFYANISQNYRSVTFNDFKIDNPSYRVDENLKDERGYNLDAGVRGLLGKKIRFDVSLFFLRYANRIGFSTLTDDNTFRVYQYRTNIGVSNTLGIESLVEYFPISSKNKELKLSLNSSFQRGKYVQSKDQSIIGNKVELIPDVSIKLGTDYRYKSFRAGALFTMVDDHFSDATNAFSTVEGISGVIPRYFVLDLNFKYTRKNLELGSGVNNVLNSAYYTRRATGYPGPGIITAQPRNFFVSLAYTL
jgi:Fe(3+) dicitrate transport protein